MWDHHIRHGNAVPPSPQGEGLFPSFSIFHFTFSIVYTKGVIPMKHHRRGFTLIEMLVVIAIIAVLVSIVIPTVTSATTKAQAGVDASNLRSTLGALNAELLLNHHIAEDYIQSLEPTESKLHPGAQLHVVYTVPGIIDVYYVEGTNYYGLAYLADIAENGTTDIEPVAPTLDAGAVWYIVGQGAVG